MTQEERQDNMRQLVMEITRAIVDDPGIVEVEAISQAENTILRLSVAMPDVGKVIGKQGRTVRSLRTILDAVGMKIGHRYTLDILEKEGIEESL